MIMSLLCAFNPKHTSKLVKQWFETNEFEIMKWSAQSPDLNPIIELTTSLFQFHSFFFNYIVCSVLFSFLFVC